VRQPWENGITCGITGSYGVFFEEYVIFWFLARRQRQKSRRRGASGTFWLGFGGFWVV